MTSIQQNNIGVKGTTAIYDPESDQYEIDLKNVSLISLDSRTKVIRIKIKSDQIHPHQLNPLSTQNIQTQNHYTALTKHENHIDAVQQTPINTNTENTNIIDEEVQDQHSLAQKLKNTTDNISIKEREQQHIQNEIQRSVQTEDFEQAAKLSQNKKQIISELHHLKNMAQTLQHQLEQQQTLEKQQRLKEEITDKLNNIQQEIVMKQNAIQDIQNDILKAVAIDDFATAASLAPNKKTLNAQINELEIKVETLQNILKEDNVHMDDLEEVLNSESEDMIEIEDMMEDDMNKEQTEEDDETETESTAPYKPKDASASMTSMDVQREDNIDSIKENEDVNDRENIEKDEAIEDVVKENEIVSVEEQNGLNVDKEMDVMDEVEDIPSKEDTERVEDIEMKQDIEIVEDIEIKEEKELEYDMVFKEDTESKPDTVDDDKKEADIEAEEDNKKEEDIEAEEDTEIVSIDVAMNEIILKSAQKNKDGMDDDKQNEDRTPRSRRYGSSYQSSDTGASTANEYQFKVDWKIAFIPHNIKKEWIARIPKSTEASTEHFSCNVSMDKCPCIDRLTFIMNNYMLWLKYKQSSRRSKRYLHRDYPKNMMSFLSLLINYNKVRLMNDYYHIRRYHLNAVGFGEYFKCLLITTQCISLKNGNRVCLQWDRNNGSKEVYRLYGNGERRNRYLISEMKPLSTNEMNEINLQQFLDMIHSAFLHKSISSGNKFESQVYLLQNDDDSDSDSKSDKLAIVDAPNYQFGLFFSYWDRNKANYIAPKYGNLKKELLNNVYCKMDKNDYNMLWYKAKDFLMSNEGKYCISSRIKSVQNSKINKIGKEMTMDHLMSLMIYCNYFFIQNKLKIGCRRLKKSSSLDVLKIRHSEIVNWCKLMRETVYCFGSSLDNDYLYHNVCVGLTFNVLQIHFNVPSSTTTKYIIAKSFCKRKGICLKLCKTFGVSRELNCFLNVCNISDFPSESECVVYGDRFDISDIIINGISSVEPLNVLKLYYQIIRGRWYTQNKNQFKKKNQREIIKRIENMMKNKKNDEYIQRMFESMTKNLRKNTVWVNHNGMEQLLPELKQLFFDEFLNHLQKNYNIKTKYGNVIILKINKANIDKSSREKAIYSTQCNHKVNIINGKNINDLILQFRCYKKYDELRNEIVLKGEFVIKPFSQRIQSIRVSGGIWFPQIYIQKWDFCTFNHNKLTKGSSLFTLKKLNKINDELIVKICFQIKDIIPAK